ncbi:hypothetical protein HK405_001011, partial [Cladochytrium tenue]
MVQCLVGHTDEIYSLDWAQDGRTVVSGSGDQSCRVWDVESGQCLMVLVNDKVVFDDAAGSPQETGVTSVALSPLDGKCLATGSLDNCVRVWDLRTGSLLERFDGHREPVYSVAFSHDGRAIVSGSLDHTVKIWDLHQTTISILSRPPTADAAVTPPPGPAAGPLRPSRPPVVATGTCRHTLAGHRDFVLTVGFAGTNASLGRVGDRGEPVSAVGSEALAEVEWVVSGSKDKHVTFWDARRAAPAAAAASRGGNGDAPTPPDPMAVAQFSLRGHDNS